MRSSEPSSSLARRKPELLAGLVIALAAVVVGTTRPRLAERFHRVKVTSDVYALPSPEQTLVLSLGFRSALADYLFANVLVSYGIHIQERRRFEFAGNYLDTVNALDPKYRAPYRYADTILTLGAVGPRPEDYVKAREILERGMAERPLDSELWTQAGQFMAYLAPAQFSDPEVKKQWRLEGARRLARACELVGGNENLPYHCITAATLLSKEGEREATIQFLERVLTVVDDEQVRALAAGYLHRTASERERDEVQWRVERFAAIWQKDLSFVSKDTLLTVGPPLDVARCAGRIGVRGAGCYASWRGWGQELARR